MIYLDLKLRCKIEISGINSREISKRQRSEFSTKMLASEIPTPRKVFSAMEPRTRMRFLSKFEDFKKPSCQG